MFNFFKCFLTFAGAVTKINTNICFRNAFCCYFFIYFYLQLPFGKTAHNNRPPIVGFSLLIIFNLFNIHLDGGTNNHNNTIMFLMLFMLTTAVGFACYVTATSPTFNVVICNNFCFVVVLLFSLGNF